MSSIESKIDKLAEKLEGGREDQIVEVKTMRTIFKTAMLKKNLAENPAMSKLLYVLRKREASITSVLSNKEDLTGEQRIGFFNRRKELRFILSFFDSADKTIESLDKQLDYQLSDDIEEDVDK